MSAMATQTYTFPAGSPSRLFIEFFSPRTGKRTFAKRIHVKPVTSDITLSSDGGQNSVAVRVADTPFQLEGTVTNLTLTGTAASTVSISAELAA